MATRLRDPFGPLLELQRALESVKGRDEFGAPVNRARVYPPVNIFRQGDDFIVVVELPGVHRQNIDLEVEGNELRLSGTKPALFGDDVNVHRRERQSGPFSRLITLPVDVDAERMKAEYRNGVLAVFVPRAERARPRKVQVD